MANESRVKGGQSNECSDGFNLAGGLGGEAHRPRDDLRRGYERRQDRRVAAGVFSLHRARHDLGGHSIGTVVTMGTAEVIPVCTVSVSCQIAGHRQVDIDGDEVSEAGVYRGTVTGPIPAPGRRSTAPISRMSTGAPLSRSV